ncbi:MAG: PRC-barrel domain-containing protein [Nanoarchaeota archaeon]
MQNKNIFSDILDKMIVTKEGKRLGFVKDIIFETKSGELINIIVKDFTPYTRSLNLVFLEFSFVVNFFLERT